MDADLLIVGGGPAGLATSIFAAKAGFSSIVFESRTYPLDKACGEGIMPSGVALLEKMGFNPSTLDGFFFDGVSYYQNKKKIIHTTFPNKKKGLGLRRLKLSSALFHLAQSQGVEIKENHKVAWKSTQVESEKNFILLKTSQNHFEGRYLIVADGLQSHFLQEHLNIPSLRPKLLRYALRRHYKLSPWSSYVEVYWAHWGEAYVTPISKEEIGVALLIKGNPKNYEEYIKTLPDLFYRLEGKEYSSTLRGAGPMRRDITQHVWEKMALVGDASGYLDALTGEGLTLAFKQANLLVESLERASLKYYEKGYKRVTRRYYWLTHLLLGLTQKEALKKWSLVIISKCPWLFKIPFQWLNA